MKRSTRSLYLINLVGFLAVVLPVLGLVFMRPWVFTVGFGMLIAYPVLVTQWIYRTTDTSSERSGAQSAEKEKI